MNGKRIALYFGVVFALFVFLTGVVGVHAVTLDDVLRDVVVTNPRILEKQKAYNAALAQQQDARSGYFPKVIFTGDVGYKAYREGGTGYKNENDGFYDARLTVSQMLYDWGQTSSLEEARKNYMLAALYAYVGEASQVTYDTIVAYLNVLKYKELRELAMQNVLVHESLLERVQLQVERGKKGRSELERVSSRMASAQSRLLLRQNDYKKAVYLLHKLLGRFTPVQEMAMPKMDTSNLPDSLKEALDLQVKFHPLLREAFYNIAQKECEHRNKKNGYWGKLSLEGVASIEDEFKDSSDYETEASIALRYRHTLFDAGRTHKVRAAASNVHKEQQKSYRVRRTLLNDIQLSWAAHKLLTEQIGVLKKNLYFTNRSLESYKEEFVLGRQTLINILNAQNENQYANEQLIDAIYSREMEKYKVLLSEGVLLSRLGLLSPLAQGMIEQDSRYVPFSNDDLPLLHDFDQDTVLDDVDVSMNSLPGDAVSKLGVSKKYDISYIYETAPQTASQEEIVIGKKDSLKKTPLQMDVTTRFDFDAFLPGTLGLTETMTTKIMKDLVVQARAYSTNMPLYITVSTNEYEDENANYSLALKRAYTLKRILQKHKIENRGVFVFANTDAPKGRNIARLKFAGKMTDYQRQYLIRSVTVDIFAQKKDQISNLPELDAMIAAIRHHSGKAEIILYSNELESMEANRSLGQKRAKLLEKYLAQKGLDPQKLTIFSWGSFRKDPLLSDSRQVNQFVQYVLR